MTSPNILAVIRRKAVPLTVNRTTDKTVVRGYVVPGTVVVLGVLGHMQPLTSQELRALPPGMNTLEMHHIWSLSEIKNDDFIGDGSAPVVRVLDVEDWKEGPFWHAFGAKVTDALVRATAYELLGQPIMSNTVPAGVGTHP